MIVEYRIPIVDTSTGEYTERVAYGCPVEVFLFGRHQRAIYQFPGGGQRCAVAHPASGQILAYVTDEHAGHPQTKAQAAINERLAELTPEPYDQAPVVNRSARQVGVLRFR